SGTGKTAIRVPTAPTTAITIPSGRSSIMRSAYPRRRRLNRGAANGGTRPRVARVRVSSSQNASQDGWASRVVRRSADGGRFRAGGVRDLGEARRRLDRRAQRSPHGEHEAEAGEDGDR